ncbi:MAG: cupin domain-containing protein [Chloroflexota bacterium]|nr:MAG: cupin domain-containing protein [Chloroflexota bacterium]
MNPRAQVISSPIVARYDELPLTNVPLFQHEDFSGCLLGFLPGQILPRHSHEHEHEVFDVLEGTGIIWLDGEAVEAPAGSVIFVPAGVEHGFENNSDGRWLIRATIHQRVYARRALQRAFEKRFGGAPR